MTVQKLYATISTSGAAKNTPNSAIAGANPAYCRRRASAPMRPAGDTTASPARRILRGSRGKLGSEHLVEGVDVSLIVARRSLQRHLQRSLRLVVVEEVGAFLVALVHEQLVGLLVEQRAPLEDEVLSDPLGLGHRIHELIEAILVPRGLDD